MKVLIVTEPDDDHAILVTLALEGAGHHVRLLYTADHPTKQKNSVFINAAGYDWRCSDDYGSTIDNLYDVVWWRRARKPYMPKEAVHPEDYPFASRENAFFFESLTNVLAPNAWWINPKAEAHRANSKLFQLKTALSCLLSIPMTLFSNDPKDIRSFVVEHQAEGVIYKPLSAGVWFEEQGMRLAYTAKISQSHLPEDALLQQVPGIFQKEIPKAFELRVVYFGGFIVAAKLFSQEHSEGKIDWRAIPPGKMEVEPCVLSRELEKQIGMFMRKMGLVFGSLDFIVTPTGEPIFLEVNEQGQFLWLEEYHSDIKMLDIFIQFLLSRSSHFLWEERKMAHCVDQYSHHQINQIKSENIDRHIWLNNKTTYRSIL